MQYLMTRNSVSLGRESHITYFHHEKLPQFWHFSRQIENVIT
jgi:hypothetical protein